MPSQTGKMIVALDCFNSDSKKMKSAVSSATAFSEQMRLAPEALAVVSPREFSWPFAFDKNLTVEFNRLGEESLSIFLKKIDGSKKMPSHVVLETSSSKRESVRSIAKAVKKKKASAVAVFTHANNSGFSLPGGFVSTLIHQSSAPVLVINSDAPEMKTIKTILVATDLSREGEQTFKKAVELAKKAKAKLKLVHVLPTLPVATMIDSSGMAGGWMAVQKYLNEEHELLKKKAKQWATKAKAMGVSTDFTLLTGTLAIASAILESAEKEKADLIVLTEKTGPWASLVLGSVTRDVLSKSQQPVLVYRAEVKGH